MNYGDFIRQKTANVPDAGFEADIPDGSILFPFQAECVRWAWKRGRAALFADTGLGKTGMQLTWADGVVKNTGRKVLVLGPLAVVRQTEREAKKFGVEGVRVVRKSTDAPDAPIHVTNYENAKNLDLEQYVGVVLDESSILKNAQGRYRNWLIEVFSQTPYKLACSATPAPNDFTELGNHSEWLGSMDEAVMRARWFINDLSDTVAPWRLKGHAVDDFWRWVCTWSRCVSKPSDMGDYDDTAYDLPPLKIEQHIVAVDITNDDGSGLLFRIPELSATSIHQEKRRTLPERIAKAKSLVEGFGDQPVIIWCETNYEQDAICAALPGVLDVRGSMKPEHKADALLQFSDDGGLIVTKPSIAGMGMNWQHCANMVFVGASYSYESFYQAVRRAWRFGQDKPVTAHVIMASTERQIWQTIHRKSGQHKQMREKMLIASRLAARKYRASQDYHPNHAARIPAWLFTQ